MTITKIQFSKTVESCTPFNSGMWTKIGIEANVAEDENIEVAIQQATKIVDDAHFKNGTLYTRETGDIIIQQKDR